MSTISIPPVIAAILPFFVTALSNYLRDDGLKPWINALIAFIAILLTGIACVWLIGGFSGAPVVIIGAVIAYVVYLMQNDYQTILQYLAGKNTSTPPAAPGQNLTAQALVAPQAVVQQQPVQEPLAYAQLESLLQVTAPRPAVTPPVTPPQAPQQ